VHEFGHFLVAKAFGVKIDRFSIGFGRALLKRTDPSGVEWRLGWIPLGGYVRFAGDENAASVPDQDNLDEMREAIRRREGQGAERRYFVFKPIWQRALVTLAGPAANFVLAIALFSTLIGVFGEAATPARVTGVAQGSPAERAGFRAGDLIVSMDGQRVEDFQEVGPYVLLRTGEPIAFVVHRSGVQLQITATPERQVITDPVGNVYRMGRLGLENRSRPVRRRFDPLTAVARGTDRTFNVLSTTLTYIGRMATGRESAEMLQGPLGIGNSARQVADYGGAGGASFGERIAGAVVALLGLAAVISVGLGFMNLLPVPVLDGGHLAFYAYEAVARRPLPAVAQGLAFRAGLAMLLGLMLFATWNDLQRLRVFQVFGGLFS
jgi:regulator of sigma E protease